MHPLAKQILDVFFPPSDDEKSIASYTVTSFQKKYTKSMYQNTVVLSSFADPAVRASIHLNKFHNHAKAQALLASLIEQFIKAAEDEGVIAIPIPLSGERLKKRGHNQVTSVLEKAISPVSKIRLKTDVLLRKKHTVAQTTLSRAKRLENITGAFFVPASRQESLRNAHILLFDDVVTTGATLKEATKILRLYKPKRITCIAFAH